jgi:FkbM family methyltransferase
VGIFTYSILHKRPKHVFCLEPSKTEFPYLVKNTIGYPVTQINKAISTGDGMTNDTSADIYFYDGLFETITFKSFLELYNINHINFLKTDCEGGEYDIFTEENIDFLKNNVDHIVGEWHLSNHIQKAKFRHFRDNYLKKFKNVNVISVDGIDIKWDLWNNHFIEYYKQVMIHISNK